MIVATQTLAVGTGEEGTVVTVDVAAGLEAVVVEVGGIVNTVRV